MKIGKPGAGRDFGFLARNDKGAYRTVFLRVKSEKNRSQKSPGPKDCRGGPLASLLVGQRPRVFSLLTSDHTAKGTSNGWLSYFHTGS